MDKVFKIMLSFTNKRYSTTYRILAMVPGTVIFLILSPLVLFFPARFLGNMISLTFSRPVELVVMIAAGVIALVLMHWSLYVLWVNGQGTPAPIAPTWKLVENGPYRFIRNPIELGTDFYFLVLGTWFDSLATGIFCMFFGMSLGLAYVKIIEEKELKMRFGEQYEQYKNVTPSMIGWVK